MHFARPETKSSFVSETLHPKLEATKRISLLKLLEYVAREFKARCHRQVSSRTGRSYDKSVSRVRVFGAFVLLVRRSPFAPLRTRNHCHFPFIFCVSLQLPFAEPHNLYSVRFNFVTVKGAEHECARVAVDSVCRYVSRVSVLRAEPRYNVRNFHSEFGVSTIYSFFAFNF